MPLNTLEVRVSLQKLLILLVVIIVPLNFVGLYLSLQSETFLEQSIGAHFRTIAEADAAAISQLISDRVIDVGTIAEQPAVVEAITAANRSYARMSEAAIAASIQKTEKNWDTREADSLVKEMLSSRASTVLNRHRGMDPRFLKIVVVDQNGACVAATDKPLHYVLPDKKYWEAVYAQGRGGIYITEVLYDERSKANYIGVGFPVLEQGSQRFIGAVNVLVDISSVFSFLNRGQMGRTGQAILVKDDGTVIGAPNVSPSMRLQSEEYTAVHDALGTLRGRQAGYIVASTRSGRRIVGFADTSLKESYPNLGWLIMVSQDEREALAPGRNVGYFALLMGLLGLLMLTLLAVYFFLHRRQQLADIEVSAQEEPPKGESNAA